MKKLFNDGWSFKKTDVDLSYADALKDGGWARVDIPHDWLIHQTGDLYETGAGWYRKTFFAANADTARIIRFDGVYMDTEIYVNGVKSGEWKYGYSSFE